jgi:phage terminase small subunit
VSEDELDLEAQSLAYRFGLTARQERFVQEYLVDLNATQAAKRAGYSTASRCAGSQIMSRPNVRQAIDHCLDERTHEYRVEHDRIIQELAALGFAQIADFVSIDGETVKWTSFDDLPRMKRAAVKKIKHGKHYGKTGELIGETIEMELEPKVRSLELLGKHVGMFRGVTPEGNKGAFAKWAEEMRRDQVRHEEQQGEEPADDGTEE